MHHACSMSGCRYVLSRPASAYAQAVTRQQHTGWGSRSKLSVTHATHHSDEPLRHKDVSRSQQDAAPASRQQRREGSSSLQKQQLEKQLDAAEDPLLANMRRPFANRHPSWQQRQQPKQRQPRGRQHQQQRLRASTSALAGPGSKHSRRSMFADCSTYQEVLTAVQQQQQALLDSASEQQPRALLVNSADTLSLIEQLAFISSSNSSGSGRAVGGSSNFIEDQALQQLLPVAYDLLRQHASSSTSLGAAGMQPRELLRCISCLASLKYSMPAQLAELLEQVPAGGKAGLSGLRMQQLASLIANLARAGVRPSNAWLVAFMQEAQAKFQAANLSQLSQLLSGLVKMGVKPAASWLDSMQEQAVQCLVEQAVRVQVTAGQMQQQQEQEQVDTATAVAAAAAAGGERSSGNPKRQQHVSNHSSSSSSSSSRRTMAGCQLHDVAQLLSALAEAKHAPKPQLAAALWGATVTSLAAADTASLVELMGALGDLQLVPPVSWMLQYYGSTYGALQSGQYKPWQLASSVAAIGKLAQAGMSGCLDSEQQQQQMKQEPEASTAGGSSSFKPSTNSTRVNCAQWVAAALQDVHRQLGSYAARDLAALLAGLAALQLALSASQVAAICEEVKQKLPLLNTAGLATLLAAVVELEQQQQQQLGSEQRQHFVLLTEDWMGAFLRETAAKLPVFPASDLAAVLCALQASKLTPSKLWLEAAAAQLHSKLTVLDPAGVVHVLDALLSMGYVPDQSWVASAVAALEARVVELRGWELQALLQALVAAGATPSSMLLDSAHWVVLQLAQQELEQQQQNNSSGYATDTCQQLLQKLGSCVGTAATISSMA